MSRKITKRFTISSGLVTQYCIIYRGGTPVTFETVGQVIGDSHVTEAEVLSDESTEEEPISGRDTKLVYIGIKDKDGKWLIPLPDDIQTSKSKPDDTKHGIQEQPGNEP